jgi:hypothetical protein
MSAKRKQESYRFVVKWIEGDSIFFRWFKRDRYAVPSPRHPDSHEVNHRSGAERLPPLTLQEFNMEKFCENHPEIAAIIIAPVLYVLLWVAMALF